jgi:hypothetical protein
MGAFDRPDENTSNALECPACGGIEIEWVTVDFTESEVQSRRRQEMLVLSLQRFRLPSPRKAGLRAGRSKAFSSVPAGSVMVIFLEH